ncbi:uncharacterized protein C8Q71DRAFT_167902 [Rhodofomes roseus]|uniref:Uncharacterized protein n=1 Tax=Rhodofomes roseus TaxID=34475 RepID=A0ABQ8K944_9APHY|nr:uncharacterized protein C8Q71DRAFT_167902 [Rhodofomes roseus]KAH9833637.1 hypothetical protein C8Q71DRAFT_167902 [Rhodofomes roseus]
MRRSVRSHAIARPSLRRRCPRRRHSPNSRPNTQRAAQTRRSVPSLLLHGHGGPRRRPALRARHAQGAPGMHRPPEGLPAHPGSRGALPRGARAPREGALHERGSPHRRGDVHVRGRRASGVGLGLGFFRGDALSRYRSDNWGRTCAGERRCGTWSVSCGSPERALASSDRHPDGPRCIHGTGHTDTGCGRWQPRCRSVAALLAAS